ncbi:NAD(P)H-hydrate dehydratase [Lihuaxuella thermophila]|uniref:Bifunctional NAD(P)H-hydrate repair enzyme n=1 Tax=Lihuaxuella thermophila TaxID=1173111 RepID=A0A1H8G505_9BACL|nr:NAD(P)H-hydrate dehydratase [Lihuaxuella thermophila]SEN38840.1 NAD(P)H-hydrate epimerase [Lihuaxuella thermophila]
MYLVTAKEMRDLDRYTIVQTGLPGVVLMENAGKAVADEVMRRFPEPKTAVVLAGAGNNGGDGWVAARHLLFRGWNVHLWLAGDEEKLTPDARVFYEVCKRVAPVERYQPEKRERLWQHLQQAEVIVDALLGTGAKGGLRPLMAELVSLINQQERAYVVAVDLPTGVDADTGRVDGEAVQADLTVTFAFPKWGHYLRPGADCSGEVKVADIGLAPVPDVNLEPSARINLPDEWKQHLRSPSPWAHKGTHGHVWIIGGSQGMLGAVTMAGQAAYRTGAGLVTLTVPRSEHPALAAKATQEIIWSWPGEGVFSRTSYQWLDQRKSRYSAVAIGPGLGRFAGEEEWLGELMKKIEVPLVLDADALNILADHPALVEKRPPHLPTVLTPHPGEMARLIGCTVKEVETSRREAATELARQTGMTVVLKGRYTILAFPDGKQRLNVTGSPALAKAGSGDLLTGMIASFLARNIPVKDAVCMAVYLHGKAGELAAKFLPQSVVVSDILSAMETALHQTVSTIVPAYPTHFPGN